MNGSNEVFVSWRITNESIIDNKTSWHVVWSFQLLKTLQSTAPERWVHCMLTRSTLKSTDISAISNSFCIRPKQFFHATFFFLFFFLFAYHRMQKVARVISTFEFPYVAQCSSFLLGDSVPEIGFENFKRVLRGSNIGSARCGTKIGRQDLDMLRFEGEIRDRRSISGIRI